MKTEKINIGPGVLYFARMLDDGTYGPFVELPRPDGAPLQCMTIEIETESIPLTPPPTIDP